MNLRVQTDWSRRDEDGSVWLMDTGTQQAIDPADELVLCDKKIVLIWRSATSGKLSEMDATLERDLRTAAWKARPVEGTVRECETDSKATSKEPAAQHPLKFSLPRIWFDSNACGWSGEVGDACYYILRPKFLLPDLVGRRVLIFMPEDDMDVVACEAIIEEIALRAGRTYRANPVEGTWYVGPGL
jgi:hypothetical protein